VLGQVTVIDSYHKLLPAFEVEAEVAETLCA